MGSACGCASAKAVQVHPSVDVVPAPSAASTALPAGSTSPPRQGQGVAAPNSGQEAPTAARTAAARGDAGAEGQPAGPAGSTVQAETLVDGPLQAPPVSATPAKPSKPKPKSLIKAVKEGNLALVDEILRSPDCNVEALGMWDNTPLLAACTYGHTDAALRLIAHKANVFAKNEHNATPMHYAAVEGSLSVVNALLEAARERGGNEDATKMVNCEPAKVYNRHLDAYGQRKPLASAAESGFADVAEVLIAASARPDEADEDGRTPLWLACRHSRVSVAKLLFAQQGVDISAKDKDGISVLGAATAGGCNEDLILAMLTHGVGDVNDTAGSPLRDAVKAGKRTVAEALLTHGASVNSTAVAGGATALHAACEKGDEHLVSLLVRSRANPSLGDASGLTAFDLLRRRGMLDDRIVALLSPPAAAGLDDGGTGSANGTVVETRPAETKSSKPDTEPEGDRENGIPDAQAT